MIPKVLIQTSRVESPPHVIRALTSRLSDGWRRIHFTDADIIKFFIENPLEEFPDIVDVFHSMPSGEHKSDLFRYYYLFIYGGVYVDSDAVLCTGIEKITKDNDFFLLYRSSTVRSFRDS